MQTTTGKATRLALPLAIALHTLACGGQPTAVTTSALEQMVTVRILIERTHWNDCSDPDGPGEIYFRVTINGHQQDNRDNAIYVNVSPFNVDQEFSWDVPVSVGTVPLEIEQWDADGGLTGDDDKCDINTQPWKELGMYLDLATCQVWVNSDPAITAACGQSIEISGEDDEDSIYIKFKVSVEEPPSAGDLALRCLHDPIWPQPGDTVTVTAHALDGAGALLPGFVDDVEIWVDGALAAATSTTAGMAGRNTLTHSFVPGGQDTLSYRCRVHEANASTSTDLFVSSGWRLVQVGSTPAFPWWGRAVPVVYTGAADSRIDLVFIPDLGTYSGATDPAFLAAVTTAIRDAYYGQDASITPGGLPFLANQDALNFWIAQDRGTYSACGTNQMHKGPAGWNDEYSFADAGVMVHDQAGGDCAYPGGNRIFSARFDQLDNFLHEAGHHPFALADEYCGDTYYFSGEPYPNIYDSQSGCQDDPLSLSTPGSCTQIQGTGGCSTSWWKLDVDGDDLMEDSGNHAAQPADRRQIDWLFRECASGDC